MPVPTNIEIGGFKVRLEWRLILVALVLMVVFVKLGFWQLSRAAEKRELQLALDQRLAQPPVALRELGPAAQLAYLPVTLRGSFLKGKNLLLVRQFYRGQAGVEVITPFRLARDNSLVLVSRGWSSTDAAATKLVPEGEQTLSGTLFLDTSQAFFKQPSATAASWPVTLRQLDIGLAASYYNEPLRPYVVRLSPNSPAVLQAHWPKPMVASASHRSYALQWFAMASLVLLALVIYSLRRQ